MHHLQVETVGPTNRKRRADNVREIKIGLANGETIVLRPSRNGNGVLVERNEMHTVSIHPFDSYVLTCGEATQTA